MLPFFFPTTVFLLDDDQEFLHSLEYRYEPSLLIRSSTSPRQAIDFLKNNMAFADIDPWRELRNITEFGSHNIAIQSKLREISRISSAPGRNSAVSVLVADFAMPEMTGIDVFRQLDAAPLKRILLTGRATQETAIEAFNAGLIDVFLTKGEDNLGERILREVQRLQHDFFEGLSRMIVGSVSDTEIEFLEDPAVEDVFYKIVKERKVKEYYVSLQPMGMRLTTRNNTVEHLLIYNEDMMRAQLEIAMAVDAPDELVEALHKKNVLGAFPNQTGFYEPAFEHSWKEHTFCSNLAKGKQKWWWALAVETARYGGIQEAT